MEVAEKLFQMPGATPERSLNPAPVSGMKVQWAVLGTKARICKNPLIFASKKVSNYYLNSVILWFLSSYEWV